MKPILFRAAKLVLPNVFERAEISADMIEYSVKHYPYTVFVQCVAHLFKVLVCAQSAVNFGIVYRIISVSHRLEHRAEINSVTAKLLDMRDILYQPQYRVGRLRLLIVHLFAAKIPDRVNVIKYRTLKPVHTFCLLIFKIFPHREC